VSIAREGLAIMAGIYWDLGEGPALRPEQSTPRLNQSRDILAEAFLRAACSAAGTSP
jgi:hypothetical protein